MCIWPGMSEQQLAKCGFSEFISFQRSIKIEFHASLSVPVSK
jgi:hypothetical protein